MPHQPAHSAELIAKAGEKTHTPAFKVMNGLVHGDTRSHVILSPYTLVCDAGHMCESIAIVVNTAYLEHGNLPPNLSVQADNASVNHSNCVLGFLALYVMYGVVKKARLRFELANHAHDIYDAFQGITKNEIMKHTYYSYAEMVGIIEAAHAMRDPRAGTAGSTGSAGSAGSAGVQSQPMAGGRPLMGPKVLVTSMWVARDIWEWLWPGRRGAKSFDYSSGAAVHYANINEYHDFEIRRDATDKHNVKADLWAKRYMSSPDYVHVGTLTTQQLARRVLRKAQAVEPSTSAHKAKAQ